MIDDGETVRNLLCITLRRHGYQVLEARDGREALQVLAVSKSLPSVILLDLEVPGMGSEELLPILETRYPGPHIIITSGFADEEACQGLRSQSIAGFLQKPYSLEALARKIAETLRGVHPAQRNLPPDRVDRTELLTEAKTG